MGKRNRKNRSDGKAFASDASLSSCNVPPVGLGTFASVRNFSTASFALSAAGGAAWTAAYNAARLKVTSRFMASLGVLANFTIYFIIRLDDEQGCVHDNSSAGVTRCFDYALQARCRHRGASAAVGLRVGATAVCVHRAARRDPQPVAGGGADAGRAVAAAGLG